MTEPVRVLATLVLLALPAGVAGQQQEWTRQFGVGFAWGVSASPLGNIAERHGTFLLPGRDHGAALLFRPSPAREWSLRLVRDGFEVDQELDSRTRSHFAYASTGVFVGFGATERELGFLPVRYGLELGWRRYRVDSERPNYYTGEPMSSTTGGDAAAVALSAGLELPLDIATLVPRFRVETGYPSFGGGDGYTELHRVSDLSLRFSLGVGLEYLFPMRRP